MPETALTQTRPEMVDEDYCPCQRMLGTLSREHHDWLLSFEARGLVGAMDLLTYAHGDEGHGTESGHLSWIDLPEFVALHSWDQPAAVHQFVQLIDSEIRVRSAATKALEQIKR